jgi:hypothetical protein
MVGWQKNEPLRVSAGSAGRKDEQRKNWSKKSNAEG